MIYGLELCGDMELGGKNEVQGDRTSKAVK